jgi:hypothetical protein
VAADLAVLVSGSGQKAVQITVSPDDLRDGANKAVVARAEGGGGGEISNYVFNVQKK